MTAPDIWREWLDDYIRASGIDTSAFGRNGEYVWTPEFTETIISRLVAGDVSQSYYRTMGVDPPHGVTDHGSRVRVRPDLGDDRADAGNYWPDKGCKCWSMAARGYCSHDLAARVFTHRHYHWLEHSMSRPGDKPITRRGAASGRAI